MEVRPTRRSADGEPVIGFGVRVGYYPCLRGPFIQFSVWRWAVDFWHGYASARQAGDR